MNKIITILCLMLTLGLSVLAQSDDANQDDEYNKNEVFGGYSNQQTNLDTDAQTFNGFEASYTRNFTRFLGAKADVSGAYNKNTFTLSSLYGVPTTTDYEVKTNSSVYNFLGGVQFKDNAEKGRIKPFGHILAGVAYRHTEVENVRCVSNCANADPSRYYFETGDNGFSTALGGGLDFRINRKFDFRVVQVDYNPIFTNVGRTNNVRFSTGFVFK